MNPLKIICLINVLALVISGTSAAAEWPVLPEVNASVVIPAQEWPQKPGPRTVKIELHYPGGKLENINADTGIMLSLHNWGGTGCGGSANPTVLVKRLNVVAICVDYLQSGPKASIKDPEPYDFGYLQSLDALRALWFVYDGLGKLNKPFASDRIFATGGSGGGNVTLMANKLAPRTFTAVIDMCGMPKLSDDIAFNLPGGSGLNARWSRDAESPNYLSPGEQEIRFNGNPAHLKLMKKFGNRTKIFVVHGEDDTTCPFPDAKEMVANFKTAGLDVTKHYVSKDNLDDKVFKSSGHSLGNRTEIVFKVGGKALDPSTRRPYLSDFDLKDEKVSYPVSGGVFVISYKNGYPIGRFEAAK